MLAFIVIIGSIPTLEGLTLTVEYLTGFRETLTLLVVLKSSHFVVRRVLFSNHFLTTNAHLKSASV